MEFHASFGVRDLAATVAFYTALFDRPPAKQRPDYAKFELDDPAAIVSFVLDPRATPLPAPHHHGLRVADAAAVAAAAARLAAAGLEPLREEVACCYAEQAKAWVVDPDGNRWEVYALLGEAEALAPVGRGAEEACCTPECCT